jgi:hypothetical protein
VKITTNAALLCLMVLMSLPANALTYAMYKKYEAMPDTNLWAMQQVNIQGMFQGITAANVALEEGPSLRVVLHPRKFNHRGCQPASHH